MRARRTGRAVGRAAIAVAALYALVLQAALGGLIVPTTADPLHILCLSEAAQGDAPFHAPAVHCELTCCTTPDSPDTAALLVPRSIRAAWPSRGAVVVAWRPEVVAAPRAPPWTSANARAPPVA